MNLNIVLYDLMSVSIQQIFTFLNKIPWVHTIMKCVPQACVQLTNLPETLAGASETLSVYKYLKGYLLPYRPSWVLKLAGEWPSWFLHCRQKLELCV